MEETTKTTVASPPINLTEKRAELVNLWQDLFTVCRTLVTDIGEGKVTLKGSLLRELNAFLKESGRIIKELEEIDRQRQIAEAYDRGFGVEADGEPDDGSDDGSIPFPVSEQSEEPLKIE